MKRGHPAAQMQTPCPQPAPRQQQSLYQRLTPEPTRGLCAACGSIPKAGLSTPPMRVRAASATQGCRVIFVPLCGRKPVLNILRQVATRRQQLSHTQTTRVKRRCRPRALQAAMPLQAPRTAQPLQVAQSHAKLPPRAHPLPAGTCCTAGRVLVIGSILPTRPPLRHL